MSRIVTLFLAILLALPAGTEEPRPLLLASTTSTENTGLFDAILPDFEKQTGIPVRVVAVGTGQALLLARSGDADVLLVHDRASEDRFVKEGYGVERFDVMTNDFVVVGPPDDPAAIRGEPDIARALGRIAASESRFVSRGDDSGTHKAEMRQWRAAGIDPLAASGRWYLELGSGMGATLNTAAAMGAYALADRGTWLAFRNRGDLDLVVEGDPRLANPYSVIAVNPARHPHVNARAAERFIEWIRSPPAQRAIGAFRVGGEPLFVPSARPPG
ncbi:MAG: substrate-binding domain-containing protein [Myxococcota bacterium]|jgi:tungstate transport system substrate-binding protein